MNGSIYHGGGFNGRGFGGSSGGGASTHHGQIEIDWIASIPIDLTIADYFNIVAVPAPGSPCLIQNPTGGYDGKMFAIRFTQNGAGDATINWDTFYSFPIDETGFLVYPRLTTIPYESSEFIFVKDGSTGGFVLVGEYPPLSHSDRLVDEQGHILLQAISDTVHIKPWRQIEADGEFNVYAVTNAIIVADQDMDLSATGDVALYSQGGGGASLAGTTDVSVNSTAGNVNIESQAGDVVIKAEAANKTVSLSGDLIGIASWGGSVTVYGTQGILLLNIKFGATQVASGAVAGEVWRTVSHATLPDNVLMIGI